MTRERIIKMIGELVSDCSRPVAETREDLEAIQTECEELLDALPEDSE